MRFTFGTSDEMISATYLPEIKIEASFMYARYSSTVISQNGAADEAFSPRSLSLFLNARAISSAQSVLSHSKTAS
jgi:hypothetical protein